MPGPRRWSALDAEPVLPEQLRTEIYQLGAVLGRVIEMDAPGTLATIEHIRGLARLLREDSPGAEQNLETAVAGLCVDQNCRTQSPHEKSPGN